MREQEYKRLQDRYKDRNLKEELAWASSYLRPGYFHKKDAEFCRWLCQAALNRINELEES